MTVLWMASDAARACGGTLTGPDVALSGFSTDSRAVRAGDLFVALRGERFDAHDFIADVQAAGAAASIVARDCHHTGGTLIRVPKAYPAYFGAYRHFSRLRDYLDRFGNLFAVGRNGMHRYNNQDHSMLAAREAVAAIIEGSSDRSSIWRINAEDAYHEEAGESA